jgi:hypothetical protein
MASLLAATGCCQAGDFEHLLPAPGRRAGPLNQVMIEPIQIAGKKLSFSLADRVESANCSRKQIARRGRFETVMFHKAGP